MLSKSLTMSTTRYTSTLIIDVIDFHADEIKAYKMLAGTIFELPATQGPLCPKYDPEKLRFASLITMQSYDVRK